MGGDGEGSSLCRCRDGVHVLQGASADIKDCKIDMSFQFGIKVSRCVWWLSSRCNSCVSMGELRVPPL